MHDYCEELFHVERVTAEQDGGLSLSLNAVAYVVKYSDLLNMSAMSSSL